MMPMGVMTVIRSDFGDGIESGCWVKQQGNDGCMVPTSKSIIKHTVTARELRRASRRSELALAC